MPRKATIAQYRENVGMQGYQQNDRGWLKMLEIVIYNIFRLINEKICPQGYHCIQPGLRDNVP